MKCTTCDAIVADNANFCHTCGISLRSRSATSSAADADAQSSGSSQYLREAGASLSATAAPLLGRLAQRLEHFAANSAAPTPNGDQATRPQATIGTDPRFANGAAHVAGSKPASERIGRGIGDTIGFGARGATGTALAPARQAWATREQLPTWQNWIGAAGLVLNFASVIGIALVGLIYLALIVSGGHGPGQAFRRLLQVFSYVFLAEIGVVVLVVIGILIAQR